MENSKKQNPFQKAKFSSASSHSEEMCEEHIQTEEMCDEYNDIFLRLEKHTTRPKSIARAFGIQDKDNDESEDIRSQSSKSLLKSAF